MKLEGSIATFPLRELIEMTVYSSVTGVLGLFWAQGEGQIFFRDGQPYHAACDDRVGLNAVVLLFEQNQASFSFVSDITTEAETIWGDPLDIVEHAARLAARWQRLRPLIPNIRLVPRPTHSLETARSYLSAEQQQIYSAIDGAHTLEGLAQKLNWDLIEVCEGIAHMCDSGVVELCRPDPVVTQQDFAAAVEIQRTKMGVLDRLLASMPMMTAAPTKTGETSAPHTASSSHDTARPYRSVEEDAILRALRQ